MQIKDTLVTEAVAGNQDSRIPVTNTLKYDGNFQAAVKVDPGKETSKSLKAIGIGIACGVISALTVGVGCGVAGVELSILI